MDRGAASDHTRTTSTHDYSKENHNAQLLSADTNSMMAAQQQQHQHHQHHLPAQAPSGLLKDAEPWRGSSGFGLANLLNRPVPSSASASTTSGSGSNTNAPLPKFSLPSLHAFGTPFKPELTGPLQHSILNPSTRGVRSPVPASPQRSVIETTRDVPRALAIHTSDPSVVDRKPAVQTASATPSPSKDATPRKQANNNNSNNAARRIAPAPADDEDGEQDDELSGSIRGGRWTADEHERFLAGFRIHGHKWKRVQQVVRTRSVTQVRTHAQKYLLKVAKLKAEKKQGKTVDMATLGDRYLPARGGADSSSDAEQGGQHTAPSSPAKRYADDSFDSSSSPARTPKKKARHHVHAEPRGDVLDQEYIAAAATTLCFLMSQKIDSLFDPRGDLDKDALEPYDCYAEAQTAGVSSASTAAQAARAVGGGGSTAAAAAVSSGSSGSGSKYMHFLTEGSVPSQFQGAFSESDRADAQGYAIEAKKLYS